MSLKGLFEEIFEDRQIDRQLYFKESNFDEYKKKEISENMYDLT